jgi:hypothetical protein
MAGLVLPIGSAQATTYLTIDQAKKILWGDMPMKKS